MNVRVESLNFEFWFLCNIIDLYLNVYVKSLLRCFLGDNMYYRYIMKIGWGIMDGDFGGSYLDYVIFLIVVSFSRGVLVLKLLLECINRVDGDCFLFN